VVTGYSLPVNKSTVAKEITATVTPKDMVNKVTFVMAGDDPTRAKFKVTKTDKAKGIITIKVFGQKATPKDKPGGDTILHAKIEGKVKAVTNVVVVVPKTQKHTFKEAKVIFENTIIQQIKTKQGVVYQMASRSYRTVIIKVFDQFGGQLASVYNGNKVVTEEFVNKQGEDLFPAGEVPILFPDAKFKNGIKEDLLLSAKPVVDAVIRAKDVRRWREFKLKLPDGTNNAFSHKLTKDISGTATMKVRVHGHLVSPNYKRTEIQKDANYPPSPVIYKEELPPKP